MAPKKNLFTNELDFRLVEEIERRPMLWDCTIDIYRRNDLKSYAWDQVAMALGPNFTSDYIADRWKNIKQTFMNNHKKVRESKNKCSGTDADGIYVPKWHLYKKLLFLKKACVQAESSSNLPVVHSRQALYQNTEPVLPIYYDENLHAFSMIPDDDNPDNNLQSMSEGTITSIVPESCPMSSISPVTNSSTSSSLLNFPSASSANSSRLASSPIAVLPSHPTSVPCSNLYENRGAKRNKSTAIMEEAINLMQKASQPLSLPLQEDDADIFGNLVATRLRDLEKEKRKQCENKILIILTEF